MSPQLLSLSSATSNKAVTYCHAYDVARTEADNEPVNTVSTARDLVPSLNSPHGLLGRGAYLGIPQASLNMFVPSSFSQFAGLRFWVSLLKRYQGVLQIQCLRNRYNIDALNNAGQQRGVYPNRCQDMDECLSSTMRKTLCYVLVTRGTKNAAAVRMQATFRLMSARLYAHIWHWASARQAQALTSFL